jgi:hypothetical protein
MVNEVEVKLKGAITVRHSGCRQSARRHIQGYIPPVVNDRITVTCRLERLEEQLIDVAKAPLFARLE